MSQNTSPTFAEAWLIAFGFASLVHGAILGAVFGQLVWSKLSNDQVFSLIGLAALLSCLVTIALKVGFSPTEAPNKAGIYALKTIVGLLANIALVFVVNYLGKNLGISPYGILGYLTVSWQASCIFCLLILRQRVI